MKLKKFSICIPARMITTEEVTMSKQENSYQVEENPESCGLWRTLKFIGKAAVFATVAAAIANAWLDYSSMPLGPRFEATYERYPSRFGDVAYAVKGQGSPLLLLHAPRIGASMAEWSAVIDALATRHTVYALDYLGWGNSDRTRGLCSAKEMMEEVQFFIEDIIGKPCTVIASGQSAPIAVNAAAQTPELFEKLVLVCPTAEATEIFEKVLWHGHWPPQLLIGIQKAAETLSTSSFLNTSISNVLTTKNVIISLARELFYDQKFVTPALINHMYTSAHQLGIRAEVFSHLSGKIDVPWENAWSQIEHPTLIIWGRQAPMEATDSATEWLAIKPDAELQMIDQAGLLPHVEQSGRFLEVVLNWLKA
jgi:pimeloyl-ACP methyl ester carboxylesterase